MQQIVFSGFRLTGRLEKNGENVCLAIACSACSACSACVNLSRICE